MRLTRDVWVAIVLILVSVFAIWDIRDLGEMSAIFPRVSAILMLICSVIYLFKSPFEKGKDKKPFAGLEAKKLIVFFVSICAYAFLIWLTGFLVASLLFICFSVWYLQGNRFSPKRRITSSVLCSLIVSIGFYFLFKDVFFVPLPGGILFGA